MVKNPHKTVITGFKYGLIGASVLFSIHLLPFLNLYTIGPVHPYIVLPSLALSTINSGTQCAIKLVKAEKNYNFILSLWALFFSTITFLYVFKETGNPFLSFIMSLLAGCSVSLNKALERYNSYPGYDSNRYVLLPRSTSNIRHQVSGQVSRHQFN
jgi:hypothetical protein